MSQSSVSMRGAIAHLTQWLRQQPTQPSSSRAVREQVRVEPGTDPLLRWLRAQSSPQKLYFRSREHAFEVAAVGFAHVLSDPVFLPEHHASLVDVLDPRHPHMRIYGACRFDGEPTPHPDPLWLPYDGFLFVLPAVELYRSSDGLLYLAVNYYPTTSPQKLIHVLNSLVPIPSASPPCSAAPLIPRAQSVHDLTDFSTWHAAMSTILDQLSAAQYSKIVLARQKRFAFTPNTLLDPILIAEALDHYNRAHPNHRQSYLFCLQIDHHQAFLGCTPECLFSATDGSVWTEALAGTVRTSPDGHDDQQRLAELRSDKNTEEHQYVIDYITDALTQCSIKPNVDTSHVKRLPRLMHLATRITGEMQHASSSSSQRHVFDLLQALHPTPAVCGAPREKTISELRGLESFDRGFFSGPLGWFSANDAEFCVAIRSALVHYNHLTAYAGSGIVRASESKSEWDETELKMSAFTDLFAPKAMRNSASPSASNSCLHVKECSSGDTTHHAKKNDPSRAITNASINGFGPHSPPSDSLEYSSSINDTPSNGPNLKNSANQSSTFYPSDLQSMPNLNILWGCCCVEELCRNGVTMFFVAPGSRSAPLAVSVASSPHATYYVAHDERGAGFLALGYAMATSRAAAVVTSSGTAVANLLPAIVEAYMSSIPLIALTADRPPELRDVGADQSIDQVNIFGRYALWCRDIPCPSLEVPLPNLLSDVDYAVRMSGHCSRFDLGRRSRGPVHLNFMFREKLCPDEQPWDRAGVQNTSCERWAQSHRPWTTFVDPLVGHYAVSGVNRRLAVELRRKQFGIVLAAGGCGSIQSGDDVLALCEIARSLGWPVISDITGNMRLDREREEVVHYGDLIFGSKLALENLCPEAVIQIGERITSKRLVGMIKSAFDSDPQFLHVLISPSTHRIDPCFTVTHTLSCDISQFWEEICLQSQHSCPNEMSVWNERSHTSHRKNQEVSKYEQLRMLSAAVQEMLLDLSVIYRETELSEMICARTICENLQMPAALFLGNSMPIRDFDTFAGPVSSGQSIRIGANRGANGIDGLICSGIGFGIGLGLDVTIVLGDMSFLHDLNALHFLREDGSCSINVRVTIVVVNNGGGGIFSMLPIVRYTNVFSPMFDTPHNVCFGDVCRSFGLEYYSVKTAEQLSEALRSEGTRHRVVEAIVSHEHDESAVQRKQLRCNIEDLVEQTIKRMAGAR